MDKLPKLKKKISSFLTKEDGKISKTNLVKAGVIVTSLSLAAAINSRQAYAGHGSHVNCDARDCGIAAQADGHHVNDLGLNYTQATTQATGTHNHCIQSCTHASHSSHGSHGQW